MSILSRGKAEAEKAKRIKEAQKVVSGSDSSQSRRNTSAFKAEYKNVLENLHGSATFATSDDIEKAGFFVDPNKTPAVVVGAYRTTNTHGKNVVRYLFHDGPEHVLTYAPTRSGKGVAIIIPTLLTWSHSAIVLDIKKENYVQSAGFRHKHLNQKVLKFEPTDPDFCSRHNMFAEVRWGSINEQQDVQNVSLTMVETDEPWDHWHSTAQELLICIMSDLWYRGVVEDRERREKLEVELAKQASGNVDNASTIYELKKPIQGNPGAAADVVSTAVSHVVSALVYDHVSAFPPVRGEKMVSIDQCSNCKVGGYDTVVGLDKNVIERNKSLKEVVGDDDSFFMKKYTGTQDSSLDFWCDDCMAIASKDPTSKQPVWQSQPGWVVDFNKYDSNGGILKTEKVVNRTHPKVLLNGVSFLSKPEDERGSVRSTLATRLVLFQDPVIAKNTAYCDWRIRDLMFHDTPVTLYMVFSPNDIDRLAPLIRLLVAQIGRTFTREMEYKDGRTLEVWNYRLLMLLDEFPAIGKIKLFEKLFAYMAGYGIKGLTICQDLAQLQSSYGEKESITSNHHIQCAYAPNRLDTAKYISELVGTTTITQEKESISRQGGTGLNTGTKSSTFSVEQTQRALLTPDEVTRLRNINVVKGDDGESKIDGGDMVIKTAGEPVILGTRALFFSNPVFLERTKFSNQWAERMDELPVGDSELAFAQTITEEERDRAHVSWYQSYLKKKSHSAKDYLDDLTREEAVEILGEEMSLDDPDINLALNSLNREE